MRTRAPLGCVPTIDWIGWPPLNTVSVGTDITWYARVVSGLASMSSLTTGTLSASSVAISSSTGPTLRHGPHHSAQKSTSTGLSDGSTALLDAASVRASAVPTRCAPVWA